MTSWNGPVDAGRRRFLCAGAAAAVTVGTPRAQAQAAKHRVEMLTKGPDGARNVFAPLIVRAAPGDTITFVPTDPGHNSASMRDAIPEGAEPWSGRIGQEISVTVEQEGVYMYQCTPHLGLGMIGAIVVGEPVNLGEVKDARYPGKAKQVAEAIFAEIES